MLVTLVPTSFHDLARMGFIFLDGRVGQEPYIVMYVKVEQRARFSTSLVHDEVVKRVVLQSR